MRFATLLIMTILQHQAFSQNDSLSALSFNGYAECYYSYDFSEPQNHEKPSFLYNHKRHNEVNVNLILLQGRYRQTNQRASLGIMTGNYAQYNLANEPVLARIIYEVNIGVRLSARRKLWLDAGVMPSHIGFESAISADCWTLTRSILADNSPYYETGIKLSYTSENDKLNLSGLFMNGWQKIQKPDYIQQPSFGFQFNYRPNRKLILNYSNFIGTDKPDSLESLRQYHNAYLQYEPTDKLGIQAGFDIGFEKTLGSDYKTWYSPVIVVRRILGKRTKVAFRGEYYNDEDEIIVKTELSDGFDTFGLSTNFDYTMSEHISFRIEGRMYRSAYRIFAQNTSLDNYAVTTNLTVRF